MSEFMQTCNMDERTNEEKIRDNRLYKYSELISKVSIKAMELASESYKSDFDSLKNTDKLAHEIIDLVEKSQRNDVLDEAIDRLDGNDFAIIILKELKHPTNKKLKK